MSILVPPNTLKLYIHISAPCSSRIKTGTVRIKGRKYRGPYICVRGGWQKTVANCMLVRFFCMPLGNAQKQASFACNWKYQLKMVELKFPPFYLWLALHGGRFQLTFQLLLFDFIPQHGDIGTKIPINGRVIYTAPYVMILMRANVLRGRLEGG